MNLLSESKNIVDPSLASREYGSCLIIGRSGTGKSSLLKKLVANFPKNRCIYLINVKGQEVSEYTKGRQPEKIKVLKKIQAGEKVEKRSLIILEDLIKLNAKESDSVRQLLNYTAHHRLCKVYCVTHTIYKTGIYSLLPLFHYIIFTSSPSNVPIVRAALATFKLEKPVLNKWVDAVKEGRFDGEGKYFFFDCTKMLFGASQNFLQRGQNTILGSLTLGAENLKIETQHSDNFWRPNFNSSQECSTKESSDSAERLARMRLLFSDYFSLHPKRQQACALFFTVSSGLGVGRISEHDLTVSFILKQQNFKKKKISLVDYISGLLDASQKKPAQDLIVIHNYVKKRCSLPKSAIINNQFVA